MSSSRGDAGPGTLQERLRAVRRRRNASRASTATGLALWIGGLTAILTVVGLGLLDFH